MYKNLFSLALVAVLVFSVGAIWRVTAFSAKKSQSQKKADVIAKDISPLEASALIKKNEKNESFIIVDVRTKGEFDEGHVRNAVNIDYYAANFSASLKKLDKNQTYLLYCRSGRRSADAMRMMVDLGFTKVYNVQGGIIGWQAEGLSLEK